MKSKTSVGDASVGMGVLAKHFIPKGDTILFITGPVVSFEESMELPDEGENTVQIGSNAYVDPLFPSRFLNHSCQPNAGIVEETCLVALMDIAPGEEIRYDYSTALLERYWTMDCACGSPKCRGQVGDFDQLPPRLQREYLEQGIVQKFIVNLLQAAPSQRDMTPAARYFGLREAS